MASTPSSLPSVPSSCARYPAMCISALLNPEEEGAEMLLHLGRLQQPKNPECLPETRPKVMPPPTTITAAAIEAQALLGLRGGFYENHLVAENDEERSTEVDDDNEDEDEEDDFDGEVDEDMSEGDRLSPTPCPNPSEICKNDATISQCKELHRQKVERITQKIRKLLGDLHIPEAVAGQKQLEREVASTLASLSPHRIMKKTVNQTTATVTFYVLKKLAAPITIKQVVQTLKDGERTRSLSRSTKPNYSRNHADVLGITKLVSSLEYKPSLLEEQPHSKSCFEATRNLAKALNCPEEVEKLACTYSAALSEQSALASRHSGSVAAGSVVLAAKSLGLKLTLTSVSSASGVSGCTIRKALRALEPLVGPTKPV